ncbi:hypothetical protein GCM10027090_22510 [Sinomonas soli]
MSDTQPVEVPADSQRCNFQSVVPLVSGPMPARCRLPLGHPGGGHMPLLPGTPHVVLPEPGDF